MVEFRRLVRSKRATGVADLVSLFESLDRQTTHTELRPVQSQALTELSKRHDDHDVVLKISTGAGKTAVGLLYLASYMEQHEEPVAYLCPTVQLVEQVLTEAARMGIAAVPYRAGEVFPHASAIAGKAVMVCTYDKLFNAKSTFDRSDVNLRPRAIVLDDAHAGVEEIRDAFTLNIGHRELQDSLLDLLTPGCKKHIGGLWEDIRNGDPQASYEVPYWAWRPVLREVEQLLARRAAQNDPGNGLIFVWPFLRDILPWCRCIVSGSGMAVMPDVLPVKKVRAFCGAHNRLFMSATLADDSVLVRELGCSLDASERPIVPQSDRGLGERMVIVPPLISPSMNREWVMRLCSRLSKKWRVVALCPSEKVARDWESVGATVCVGDGVGKAIDSLTGKATTDLRFVAFAQRYDGVDLPDNACRILVIDGIPRGDAITDKYDSSRAAIPAGPRNRLAYRLEQGMGRAVRSHVDYAVVILSGDDLAHFVSQKNVLNVLNPVTRLQLDLARDLAKIAQDDVAADPESSMLDMVTQCLTRDEGWKQYYEETVRRASTTTTERAATQKDCNLALAERRAFECASNGNVLEAEAVMRAAMQAQTLTEEEEGWYLQKVASYQYQVDPGAALNAQSRAYALNPLTFRPPPSAGKVAVGKKFPVQERFLTRLKQFENPSNATAFLESLRARLGMGVSSDTMENALMELAAFLGAEGLRPEEDYKRGPDVLWLWPDLGLVIEAKNERRRSLPKKDAGQLIQSVQWCQREYPSRKVAPIVVSDVIVADRNAEFPPETRIITSVRMNALLDQIDGLFTSLFSQEPMPSYAVLAGKQIERGLSPERFLSQFTVPIRRAR